MKLCPEFVYTDFEFCFNVFCICFLGFIHYHCYWLWWFTRFHGFEIETKMKTTRGPYVNLVFDILPLPTVKQTIDKFRWWYAQIGDFCPRKSILYLISDKTNKIIFLLSFLCIHSFFFVFVSFLMMNFRFFLLLGGRR